MLFFGRKCGKKHINNSLLNVVKMQFKINSYSIDMIHNCGSYLLCKQRQSLSLEFIDPFQNTYAVQNQIRNSYFQTLTNWRDFFKTLPFSEFSSEELLLLRFLMPFSSFGESDVDIIDLKWRRKPPKYQKTMGQNMNFESHAL